MTTTSIPLPIPVIDDLPADPRPDGPWASDAADALRRSGVVLIRGLDRGTRFEDLVSAVTGEDTLEYSGGATPRTRVEGRVYTSTDFPAEHHIDLHSEMAYAPTWPTHLGFFSVEAAEEGGQTPLAPTDRVVQILPAELVSRLRDEGVTYIRRFDPLFGGDWRAAYGVGSFDEAVTVAAARGEVLERAGDGVTARITLPALLGEGADERWFNQLVAFNAHTLPAETYRDLVEVCGVDGFPKDTRFGGGDPIDRDTVEAIRRAVDEVTVTFRWRAGDLLVVDNREYAHGRRPYSGPRQLRVCMTGDGTWPTDGSTDRIRLDEGANR